MAQPTEQLTEPEASFSLAPFDQVTVNVDSNDIATTTTTTTTLAPTTTTLAPTTTSAATTTLAPTTAGPTTTNQGAGVVTLPATGQSGQSGWVATVALLMLVLGAGAVVLSRRAT